MKDVAQKLVDELGHELNLVLALNENNVIEFAVEDKFVVILHYSEELKSFVINIVLGSLAGNENTNELMLEMLSGNYLWGLTAGGHLAIEAESQLVCLNKLYELPESAHTNEIKAFLDIFGHLFSVARYWNGKMEGSVQSSIPFDTHGMMRV